MKRILVLMVIGLFGLWLVGYGPVVDFVNQILGRAHEISPVTPDMAAIQERSEGLLTTAVRWYQSQHVVLRWLLIIPLIVFVLGFIMTVLMGLYRLIRSLVRNLRDAID
ncbi:hypothetical protein IAI18_22395 [Acetobacteraceae bacterium H6797]|nr:hypothetical protein [Acetobacteraceae bacterium H6797]